MSEFKGTPSEWKREGLTVYALDERSQVNRFSCRIDGGYQVKSPFQARLAPPEELYANARLIAAAPDLLEALMLMVDTFSDPGAGEVDRILVTTDARNAIAKALQP